jgi:hypothetical protein
VVVTLDLRRSGDDAFPVSPRTHDQVAFVVDGQITELRDATDRDEALCAIPSAPPSPLGPRSAITSATAVLPVRDVRAALEHYRRLGFTVHAYEGGGYGFVERDNIEVHPGEIPDLDPSGTPPPSTSSSPTPTRCTPSGESPTAAASSSNRPTPTTACAKARTSTTTATASDSVPRCTTDTGRLTQESRHWVAPGIALAVLIVLDDGLLDVARAAPSSPAFT